MTTRRPEGLLSPADKELARRLRNGIPDQIVLPIPALADTNETAEATLSVLENNGFTFYCNKIGSPVYGRLTLSIGTRHLAPSGDGYYVPPQASGEMHKLTGVFKVPAKSKIKWKYANYSGGNAHANAAVVLQGVWIRDIK